MAQSWAGVAGSPIGHSLSPVLHRAAYDVLGLDWEYRAIDCAEAGLAALLERCLADPHWRGLSMTMPLKRAAVGLVPELDPLAERVGAVNTVVPGGRGHNTDVAGILGALGELELAPPSRAVVLGGGGTALAALAALDALGLAEVELVVRDPTRLDGAALRRAAGSAQLTSRPWPEAGRSLEGAGLVVATTPAGATDGLAAAGWPAGVPLLDVLYAPWPTRLAAAAAEAGAPVAGGMAVLTHQAAAAVQLMTGLVAPLATMRAAGDHALSGRSAGGGEL